MQMLSMVIGSQNAHSAWIVTMGMIMTMIVNMNANMNVNITSTLVFITMIIIIGSLISNSCFAFFQSLLDTHGGTC